MNSEETVRKRRKRAIPKINKYFNQKMTIYQARTNTIVKIYYWAMKK